MSLSDAKSGLCAATKTLFSFYRWIRFSTLLGAFLFLMFSVGANAATYTQTASIAALKAYGASSSTVAYAHVTAYYAGGTTGGGDFYWAAACPGTTNDGTWVAATGVGTGCWVREVSGGLDPYMFGAKGTRMKAPTDCSITNAGVVTCPTTTFTSADVGSLASFYLAGAVHAGGRNWTHNSTIATYNSAHSVTLTNTTTTVVSANGVFAFGPDDTAAMNAALAANGPEKALQLTAPGYMIQGTFLIGNASATWTHNIHGVGNPTIYCYITNPGAHSPTDCVHREASSAFGYMPTRITGSITFDNMNNGFDGFVDMGGYNAYQENVTVLRSYRNCWARRATDSAFIQQYTMVNTTLSFCGLHGIANWTNATSSSNGFIDEIMHIGLDIEGWGYNSGQLSVTGDQMGAAIYSVNTGAGIGNFILGHTFLGPLEFNNDKTSVTGFGGGMNPNAVFFADGQQPNVVFGGCSAAPCFSAVGYSFRRWYFESPTIECSLGCSPPLSGALFAFQTTRQTPSAMRFQDIVSSGHWNSLTSNISFGTDCSSSGTGCGNFISQSNVGPPTQTLGYNLAVAGSVTGRELGYQTTVKSSVSSITVPWNTATDLTTNLGNVHNWVNVSGECGAIGNFDDWVPWAYFGNAPAAASVLKGNVHGTPPTRTYTINGATGFLALTTSVGTATSCSVHVSPFGGY